MSKMDDEYEREFDLVAECVDLHTGHHPLLGEIVYGTPSNRKLLRARKKLAANGRDVLHEYHAFLVRELGLAEHTARQALSRLVVAIYETNNKPWRKLRIRSISYSYKKALHADLRKWVLYLTDCGRESVDEGSTLAEMIEALVESPFWGGGDARELIHGYLRAHREKLSKTLPPAPQPVALLPVPRSAAPPNLLVQGTAIAALPAHTPPPAELIAETAIAALPPYVPSPPISPESLREKIWLSYAETAVYTGYSVGHLRNLVSTGSIPVYGKPGSPKFRHDMVDLWMTDRDAAMRLYWQERKALRGE
jgi:hypothetical protein